MPHGAEQVHRGDERFRLRDRGWYGKGWLSWIAFEPRRSALGYLLESPDLPMASYVKSLVGNDTRFLFLDSKKMRNPGPPHLCRDLLSSDGRTFTGSSAHCRSQSQNSIKRGWNTSERSWKTWSALTLWIRITIAACTRGWSTALAWKSRRGWCQTALCASWP